MLARLSMLLSTYLNLEYVGKQPPMTQTGTAVTTITKTVVITETVTTTERVNTTQPYISNYRGDITTTLISICVIIILALALLITKTPPGQTTKHTTT
jgi:hypothetical protein